jgi:hypothetical protein
VSIVSRDGVSAAAVSPNTFFIRLLLFTYLLRVWTASFALLLWSLFGVGIALVSSAEGGRGPSLLASAAFAAARSAPKRFA